MSNREDHAEQLLDRILDGEATEADLEAVRQSPELQAQLESMRSINEGLRRIYQPAKVPESEDAAAPIPISRAKQASGLPRRKFLAYAASIAIIGVMWFVLRPSQHPEIKGSQLFIAIGAHMSPEHVCSNSEEFEVYTHEQLGVAITAAFSSPVEFVGWRSLWSSYTDVDDTEPGRILLARDENGENVLVFFVRSYIDEPLLGNIRTLHTHTKRLGRITAYEVSESENAVVLPLIERVR